MLSRRCSRSSLVTWWRSSSPGDTTTGELQKLMKTVTAANYLHFSGIWPTKASNTCASISICPQKSFQRHSSAPLAQKQLVPVPLHVPTDPRVEKTVKPTDAHPDKAKTRRPMSELALVTWNWWVEGESLK
jgi:hypothetical protein